MKLELVDIKDPNTQYHIKKIIVVVETPDGNYNLEYDTEGLLVRTNTEFTFRIRE